PDANKKHESLREYLLAESKPTGWWSNYPKYMVSLLKAWFGDAATEANEYGYRSLPKILGNHSHYRMFEDMYNGIVKGLMVLGQNPAVGGQNAVFHRKAMANLDWLVVRDPFMIETATFWYEAPEVKTGEVKAEDIKTEVFFLPS